MPDDQRPVSASFPRVWVPRGEVHFVKPWERPDNPFGNYRVFPAVDEFASRVVATFEEIGRRLDGAWRALRGDRCMPDSWWYDRD